MATWHQTIRTGNPATDLQLVEAARAHAASQGLALHVEPLSGGGFQVQAGPAPSPYAPLAPYAPPGAAPMQVAPRGSMAVGAGAGHCQACRRQAPTKDVMFMQNVGCLVIRFPKTIRGSLCRLCIGSFFWRYTLITLFFGWWGFISFFYSLVSIPTNIVTFLGARRLPVDFDGNRTA